MKHVHMLSLITAGLSLLSCHRAADCVDERRLRRWTRRSPQSMLSGMATALPSLPALAQLPSTSRRRSRCCLAAQAHCISAADSLRELAHSDSMQQEDSCSSPRYVHRWQCLQAALHLDLPCYPQNCLLQGSVTQHSCINCIRNVKASSINNHKVCRWALWASMCRYQCRCPSSPSQATPSTATWPCAATHSRSVA